MKAKKIAMIISFGLSILGLLLAFIFTFTNAAFGKMEQLLVNLSIGLSTGGLVALLIEIPMALSTIAVNKRLLTLNGFHTYRSCAILVTLVDTACKNEGAPIYKAFCTSHIDKINYFALPLLNLDPHMYINSVKRKKIIRFIETISNFTLQREAMEAGLQIKINIEQIRSLQAGKRELPIASRDVKYELEQIKGQVVPICDTINDCMSLVLNEKELNIWHKQLEYINKDMERIQANLQANLKEESE